MLTLEHSWFAKALWFAVFLFGIVDAYAEQLQLSDLTNQEKVVAALEQRLTDEERQMLEAFVSEAQQATIEKRYGPAIKAWGAACLIQPDARNLANLAQAILLDIGLTKDHERAQERRSAAFPVALGLLEAALAAEPAQPSLGHKGRQVVVQRDCLKAYLDDGIVSQTCEPLIWSGLIE